MHDIRLIRDNPEAFDAGLARRGVEPQSAKILDFDKRKRALQHEADSLRADKKRLSAFFGQLASQGQANTSEALNFKRQSVEVAAKLSKVERQLDGDEDLAALLAGLPNIPFDDVPEGKDEDGNVEVNRWGTPRSFDFTPKEHADLGSALGLDFETGAAIAGARFTFLRGQMARLQRALGQYMLDMQTAQNGYTECAPPLLVKDEAAFGTGQLPKFTEDLFYTYLKPDYAARARAYGFGFQDAKEMEEIEKFRRFASEDIPKEVDRRWLIPTAEVSLTNSVREQILAGNDLPLRMAALTPCFRSEAGSAGKDTRGYIRQHQFEKVELVTICKPEDSPAEHEKMTADAEAVLQGLGLPYRKMLLCAGDMGFTARKTYDLEVWLPGQDTYREISSISTCGDFQARRMNARYRPEGQKGTEFVHTLNGSGLAVGRTLVAVLENYQHEDGSVDVPEALVPYMGGVTRLVP